jgi:hypothetical protein
MAQQVDMKQLEVWAYHTLDGLVHLQNPFLVREMRIRWTYPNGPHYVEVIDGDNVYLTNSQPEDLKAVFASAYPHLHIIGASLIDD